MISGAREDGAGEQDVARRNVLLACNTMQGQFAVLHQAFMNIVEFGATIRNKPEIGFDLIITLLSTSVFISRPTRCSRALTVIVRTSLASLSGVPCCIHRIDRA